jgi:hypothetical protein
MGKSVWGLRWGEEDNKRCTIRKTWEKVFGDLDGGRVAVFPQADASILN